MASLPAPQRLAFARWSDSAVEPGSYAYERHVAWLRYLGVARVGVLSFLAVGAALMELEWGEHILLALYVVGFVSSLWYLQTIQRYKRIDVAQCWVQMLVDFSVVAATVSFTQGPSSFFTFMFVVVVLEAGLLLGLKQGFVIASFAVAFMLSQTFFPITGGKRLDRFEVVYNFLVQSLAFYLTAFISGYWNQRIHRLQEFQREILDNMNSGFLITDRRGVVTVQNEAAYGILGLPAHSGIGQSVASVLRVAARGECPVMTALRSGQDFTSYEFNALREDGQEVLLGLTTNCVRDSDGEVTGVIASFTDLTEISAMREELRRQDRLAVVGELAAGLAHEIRNPVAVIRGALEELEYCAEKPELEAKLRGMAIRESDHLNEIVTGFLNFAREPSRKRETIDVRDLVREVAELLEREYEDRDGIAIRLHLADASKRISCDASQLKQVFVNLGKNAIEAMGFRGQLDITVNGHHGPVEVRFDDEGPGIEPDKLSRIFEPFYTTKETGVGMGLAVCMRIITAHDGTIHAAAREGGGCSMSVLLPATWNGKEPVR